MGEIVETEDGIKLSIQDPIRAELEIPKRLLIAGDEEERWKNAKRIAKRIFKAAFSARGRDIETRIIILTRELEEYLLSRGISLDLWEAIDVLWSNAIDYKLVAEFLQGEDKRELAARFLDLAPQILKELKERGEWAADDDCCIIRPAEKIAVLLNAAAVDLAEKEGGYYLAEIRGKFHPAYKGPARLVARVDHVERGGEAYVVVEAEYGDRTARVALNKRHTRFALLANLAAAATHDVYNLHSRISHITTSYLQAAERLLTWSFFMPGDYPLEIKYVYLSRRGLTPRIEVSGAITPVHVLAFKLAKAFGGIDTRRVLSAAWLLVADILATPDGKKPSEGLAILAKRMVEAAAAMTAAQEAATMRGGKKAARKFGEGMARALRAMQGLEGEYKRALTSLRPYVEELDALLGPVSADDKRLLVSKMARYDREFAVKDKIGNMAIEVNGVKIYMVDVIGAAGLIYMADTFGTAGLTRF